MVTFLKVLLSLVWLFMVYMVISTSLESSLFKEWVYLAAIPWMRATLCDFQSKASFTIQNPQVDDQHICIEIPQGGPHPGYSSQVDPFLK